MGPRGQKRDEKLLEEVFRLCCRYAGQTPGQGVFVPEIQQALGGNIGWNRIVTYLRFLDGTLLIRLIAPLELRLKRKKSPSKVCLCDHALRASWLQEVIPLAPDGLSANPHLADLAGHLAESVLGYFLASIPNLDVAHFPARGIEPEVDFVITVGTRRIPVEVKYRNRIDPHQDTLGLRAFLEKTVYNASFGLLVTLHDDVQVHRSAHHPALAVIALVDEVTAMSDAPRLVEVAFPLKQTRPDSGGYGRAHKRIFAVWASTVPEAAVMLPNSTPLVFQFLPFPPLCPPRCISRRRSCAGRRLSCPVTGRANRRGLAVIAGRLVDENSGATPGRADPDRDRPDSG